MAGQSLCGFFIALCWAGQDSLQVASPGASQLYRCQVLSLGLESHEVLGHLRDRELPRSRVGLGGYMMKF